MTNGEYYFYNQFDKADSIFLILEGEVLIEETLTINSYRNNNQNISHQNYFMNNFLIQNQRSHHIQKQLYQIGPGGYFGDYQISQKISLRQTQAKSNFKTDCQVIKLSLISLNKLSEFNVLQKIISDSKLRTMFITERKNEFQNQTSLEKSQNIPQIKKNLSVHLPLKMKPLFELENSQQQLHLIEQELPQNDIIPELDLNFIEDIQKEKEKYQLEEFNQPKFTQQDLQQLLNSNYSRQQQSYYKSIFNLQQIKILGQEGLQSPELNQMKVKSNLLKLSKSSLDYQKSTAIYLQQVNPKYEDSILEALFNFSPTNQRFKITPQPDQSIPLHTNDKYIARMSEIFNLKQLDIEDEKPNIKSTHFKSKSHYSSITLTPQNKSFKSNFPPFEKQNLMTISSFEQRPFNQNTTNTLNHEQPSQVIEQQKQFMFD